MDPATVAAVADVGLSLMNRNKTSNRANILANYWATVNQQNFQREMMNEQNEYNKPVNQVKRLLEANLNPYAEFGVTSMASADASGGVSNVPNLVTPDRTKLDLLGKINTINAMREQKARTDNINANTNAITDNMRIKEAQLGLEQSKTLAEINKLRVESGLAPLKAEKLKQEIEWLKDKEQPVPSLTTDPVGNILGNIDKLKKRGFDPGSLPGNTDFEQRRLKSLHIFGLI